jgi:hypothetical protein
MMVGAAQGSRPSRTIKYATDLVTLVNITSDELISMDEDRYNEVRRAATRGRLQQSSRYGCPKCGYGLYAPRDGLKHLPYWKHFGGAPKDCPWYTGKSRSIDDVGGDQFGGAQESPLHFRLKHEIGKLLTLEGAFDVRVDEYLILENGRRRPDIRAKWKDKEIAIEVQLSHTQIPIIIQREDFYAHENIHLIWMTWCFEPQPFLSINRSIIDVYFSQNKNIFSLDEASISRGYSQKKLTFAAYQENDGNWTQREVELLDLVWQPNGLPYAIKPPFDWRTRWINEWCRAQESDYSSIRQRRHLLQRAIDRVHLNCTSIELEEQDITALLNCLLSLGYSRPIGSRQRNVVEVINSFLNSPRRHRYAEFLRRAILSSKNASLLDRESVRESLSKASQVSQEDQSSSLAKLLAVLFPHWSII